MIIDKLRNKQKGFTLFELLGVIVVLSILCSIAVWSYASLKDESEQQVTEIQNNLLLVAAENYYKEFYNASNWKSFVGENDKNISCVDINSMINQGLFGSNEETIENIKDSYAVMVTNDDTGVPSYKVVDRSECYYLQRDSVGSNNSSGSSGDVSDVGDYNLSQSITEGENGEYYLHLSFKMKILSIEEVQKNVYVVYIMDRSGSMSGSDYTNAKSAAVTSSNYVINNIAGAQVGLVTFASSSSIARGFSNAPLTNNLFPSATGGTYYQYAFDDALELFNGVSDDNAIFFTIFLSDGVPSSSSYTSQLNNLKNKSSIFTISYGSNISVLKNIASKPEYFYESGTDLNQITSVFEEISHTIEEIYSDISSANIHIDFSDAFSQMYDSEGNLIPDNKVSHNINLKDYANGTEEIELTYDYVIHINYDDIGCDDGNTCSYTYYVGDISIDLIHDDGTIQNVVVDKSNIPSITITVSKIGVLN